jgi:hypothetical protein
MQNNCATFFEDESRLEIILPFFSSFDRFEEL